MAKDLTITRRQLEAWAGRSLTDTEVERITGCVPRSSIPDAINTIANEAIRGTEEG